MEDYEAGAWVGDSDLFQEVPVGREVLFQKLVGKRVQVGEENLSP